MLALVCSGRPVQTTAVQVAPSKWMFEVPAGVQHLAVFFTAAPPPNCGAAVYHSLLGEEWRFLGALTAEKPSAIYKLSAPTTSASKLGIDIELLDAIDALHGSSVVLATASGQQGAALKLLESLYNYVMSFTNDPTNPMQAIPVRLFNDWYSGLLKRNGRDVNQQGQD